MNAQILTNVSGESRETGGTETRGSHTQPQTPRVCDALEHLNFEGLLESITKNQVNLRVLPLTRAAQVSQRGTKWPLSVYKRRWTKWYTRNRKHSSLAHLPLLSNRDQQVTYVCDPRQALAKLKLEYSDTQPARSRSIKVKMLERIAIYTHAN